MKRIYEVFKKTKESFIFIKINLDSKKKSNININIPFIKHMIESFIINSNINLDIILIGDNYIDYHHIIEDLGILLGLSLKYSNNNKYIKRFGYSNIILEDSKTFVLCDLSKRSYLDYNIFYNRLYIGNLDIDLFYDFFLSITNNLNMNLFIFNQGYNMHHKIESIFKCFGLAFRNSIQIDNKINSTKGIL